MTLKKHINKITDDTIPPRKWHTSFSTIKLGSRANQVKREPATPLSRDWSRQRWTARWCNDTLSLHLQPGNKPAASSKALSIFVSEIFEHISLSLIKSPRGLKFARQAWYIQGVRGIWPQISSHYYAKIRRARGRARETVLALFYCWLHWLSFHMRMNWFQSKMYVGEMKRRQALHAGNQLSDIASFSKSTGVVSFGIALKQARRWCSNFAQG